MDQFPTFAAELTELLVAHGEDRLAGTVDALNVIDRGDDFCAAMYTSPRPSGAWGTGHRNLALDSKKGILIVDVVDERIVEIEILYRDEIRVALLAIMP
jgi:hypothetical protein